jgi:hypothetical protein
MRPAQLPTSLIAIVFLTLTTQGSGAQNNKSAVSKASAKAPASSASAQRKDAPAKSDARSKNAKKRNFKSEATLNANSITGTYESGNNALGSELKVQELAGGKMKFSLYSFWRCPDGTACNGIAESTIPVAHREATYHQTDPEYTLKFAFSKNACVVECDKPSNFGGFNVDPSGAYKKTRAKVVFD